mmetsp:Transcript_121855/g.235035  ORF Transcript_121855/g.235035 Transcript_121855/m.235035 type:complete len:145 (-) Transcript_121855:61-495(-)
MQMPSSPLPDPVGAPETLGPPKLASLVPPGFVHIGLAATDVTEREGVRVSVDGRDIAVFLRRGNFYAIDADCPHQGAALESGDIEDCGNTVSVSCPQHGWCFELDSGYCEDIGDYGLQAYAVTVLDDGGLCISSACMSQPSREE